MRIGLIILFLVVLMFSGCADSAQRGSFAVTNSEWYALAGSTGSVAILQGTPLGPDGQPNGPVRPLVYWFMICPGLDAKGSSHESDDSGYKSVRKQTWLAAPNDVSLKFEWNRRTDIVDVGGKQFDRSRGNIFVELRQPNEEEILWQIEGLKSDDELSKVIEHVRRKLADNKLVQEAVSKPISTH